LTKDGTPYCFCSSKKHNILLLNFEFLEFCKWLPGKI
jgi:hypothetical protein